MTTNNMTHVKHIGSITETPTGLNNRTKSPLRKLKSDFLFLPILSSYDKAGMNNTMQNLLSEHINIIDIINEIILPYTDKGINRKLIRRINRYKVKSNKYIEYLIEPTTEDEDSDDGDDWGFHFNLSPKYISKCERKNRKNH